MSDGLTAVLAAVGGGSVSALVAAFAARRKARAEARKARADATAVVTGAALEVLEAMRDELTETRKELQAMRKHLSTVEDLLRSHGLPVPEFAWPPPERGSRD